MPIEIISSGKDAGWCRCEYCGCLLMPDEARYNSHVEEAHSESVSEYSQKDSADGFDPQPSPPVRNLLVEQVSDTRGERASFKIRNLLGGLLGFLAFGALIGLMRGAASSGDFWIIALIIAAPLALWGLAFLIAGVTPGYEICDFIFLGANRDDPDGHYDPEYWRKHKLKEMDYADLCNNRACATAQYPLKGTATNPNAYEKWGLIQFEASLGEFAAALRASPKRAEIHYNRGRASLMAARNFRSLRLFERARASYHDAVEDNTNAINLDSALAEAYVNRGCAHALKVYDFKMDTTEAVRDREQALEDFEAAVRANPNLLAGHINRALVLKELGRSNQGGIAVAQSLQIHPGNRKLRVLARKMRN